MVAFSTVFSTTSTLFLVALPVLGGPSPEKLTGLFVRQLNPSPEKLTGLFVRQLNPSLFDPSSLPSTCISTCQNVETNITACTALTCVCSTTISQELASCLDCGVAVKDSGLNATYAQSLMNAFISNCNEGGITLSPVTITGSTSGGGSSNSSTTGGSSSGNASTTSGSSNTTSNGSSGGSNGSSSSTANSAMRTGAIGGVALAAIAFVFTFA